MDEARPATGPATNAAAAEAGAGAGTAEAGGAPAVEPRHLSPGGSHRVHLRGVSDGVRVSLVRGPVRCFERPLEPGPDGPAFTLEVPADAVRGVYTVVVQRGPGRRKVVIRDGLSVVEPAWRDPRHPRLPEYDRWHYLTDEAGIPMKDMGGTVGYVRHPLVATYFAARYAAIMADPADARRDAAAAGFRTIVDWLETQATDGPGGSLVVRHAFPITVSFRLEPGWISGLTQGRVAEVFLTAARVRQDDRYRELARRCCEIMRVPVEEGGLLAVDASGAAVIEEYPTDPASWALNGIGSAVHSLETIAEQLELPWAEPLIDRVCEAIGDRIPLFDAPEVPGSRVQLALRYDVTLRARTALGRPPSRLTLHEVRVAHHAERPTVLAGSAAGRPGASQRGEGPALVGEGGRLDLELLLSGNRDPFDAGDVPSCTLELDLTASARSVAVLTVPGTRGRGRLGPVLLRRGRRTVRFHFDPDRLVPGGVGRIAAWNETYHTTNLAWMWQLSRYGRDPRTAHLARRWLFSLHTGLGRIPLAFAGVDLAPLEAARDEAARRAAGSTRPMARAAAMQAGLATEILALAAGRRPAPTVAWTCPRRAPAGWSGDLLVAGFPFAGGETARLDGRPVPVRTRAADELTLAVGPLPPGRHVIELHAADGRAIEPSPVLEVGPAASG